MTVYRFREGQPAKNGKWCECGHGKTLHGERRMGAAGRVRGPCQRTDCACERYVEAAA